MIAIGNSDCNQAMTAKENHSPVYRVFLSGVSIDSGNRGCRALTTSMIDLITTLRDDSRIDVFTLLPPLVMPKHLDERTIEKLNVVTYAERGSTRGSLLCKFMRHLLLALLYRTLKIETVRKRILSSDPFLKSIASADLVGDIAEGDSFSDLYGLPRLIRIAFPSVIAIILGKTPVLLPQTYGPYRSTAAKRIATFIMRRSKAIYARDQEGLDTVKHLLNGKTNDIQLRYCPDVAFSLKAFLPSSPKIEPRINLNLDFTIVGLNISGLVHQSRCGQSNPYGIKIDYGTWVHQLVERLLRENNVHVLLLPHVFSSGEDDDYRICRRVWSELKSKHEDRVHFLTHAYDEAELKGIIGQCDFFVGSRMHACIAALSQGIPTVGIAYSHKFAGLFNAIGLGSSVVDAREVSTEEAVGICIGMFNTREETRSALQNALCLTKKSLYDVMEEIVSRE